MAGTVEAERVASKEALSGKVLGMIQLVVVAFTKLVKLCEGRYERGYALILPLAGGGAGAVGAQCD